MGLGMAEMTGKSRLGEIIVLCSAVGVGRSMFGDRITGLSHDWIIIDELHDSIKDMADLMKEQQEKAQKNYLSMMPKYNGGKK